MAERDPYGPDEGDPGGEMPSKAHSGTHDVAGATVVLGPTDGLGGLQMKPGPARRFYDPAHPPTQEQGVQKVAVEMLGRPVKPVKYSDLPYDPMRHVGAVPTRFTQDPRTMIGSSTDVVPWYVLKSRLQARGAQEYDFCSAVIHAHGQRGSVAPPDIVRQLTMLARYGDQNAAVLLDYAQRVAYAVQQANANAATRT